MLITRSYRYILLYYYITAHNLASTLRFDFTCVEFLLSNSNFRNFLLVPSSSLSYRCNECNSSFGSPHLVEVHQQADHDGPAYCGLCCGAICQADMDEHMKLEHSPSTERGTGGKGDGPFLPSIVFLSALLHVAHAIYARRPLP